MKRFFFIFIALFYFIAFYKCNYWQQAAYNGDSWGYYAHLPATFIYGDVGNYEQTINAVKKYAPGLPDPRVDKYGVRPTPTGKYAIKYSQGLAVLWLPFFAVAHFFCKMTGFYAADGFSAPYMLLVGLSVIFYVLLGFWFLWQVLIRYFDEKIVLMTLLALSLGTNLFYFTVYNNLMAHALLFSAYCCLIYASDSFYRSPSHGLAMGIATSLAMIVLIRTNELYAIFIPFCWGFTSWKNRSENFLFLRKQVSKNFFFLLLPFVFIFSIQLFYWKYVSNQWFYYAYAGETFDFTHPHIRTGLIGFQNGWLIWTPIMVFALLGLFFLPRRAKPAFLPILLILPLHIFIIYSWWCHTYINGFGSRPMVELYGLLAFGLASIASPVTKKERTERGKSVGLSHISPSLVEASPLPPPSEGGTKSTEVSSFPSYLPLLWRGLGGGLILLNLFQTYQEREGLIRSQECKPAYYWSMFGRTKNTHESLAASMSNEREPAGMTKISDLHFNGFEDSTSMSFKSNLRYSGKYSFCSTQEYCGDMAIPIEAKEIRAGDRLRVSIQGFFHEADREGTRWITASLVTSFVQPSGEEIKHAVINIPNFIGNTNFNIWTTGKAEMWGEAYFFVEVPATIQPNDVFKCYVWNPTKKAIFLDDLKVELWR
jgi:hypothetical protein